jgi:hypothetical protein
MNNRVVGEIKNARIIVGYAFDHGLCPHNCEHLLITPGAEPLTYCELLFRSKTPALNDCPASDEAHSLIKERTYDNR